MAKKSDKPTAKSKSNTEGKSTSKTSKTKKQKTSVDDSKNTKVKSEKSKEKVEKKPVAPKSDVKKEKELDKVTNKENIVENSVENKAINQVGAEIPDQKPANNVPVEENKETKSAIIIGTESSVVEVKKEEPTPVVEKPFDIYDGESVKEVLEFPPTQLETQTQLAVKRYGLDIKRLPASVVDKINAYLTIFRDFVANPNDVSKIPNIMAKDQEACDAINAWAAPKAEYFEKEKLKQAGGIAVTQVADSKVVVDKNNSQTVINGAPSVPSATNNPTQPTVTPLPFHPQAGQNGTPDSQNYHQHQFNPQNPASTYVHNVANVSNDIGDVNLPPAYGDNSKEVNRLMAQMAQNPVQNQAPVSTPINTNTRFLEEYAKTIHNTITATFQHNHWGYIPLSVLKSILANTEKSLSYDIVMGNAANSFVSFIKISDGTRTVETSKFNCQEG